MTGFPSWESHTKATDRIRALMDEMPHSVMGTEEGEITFEILEQIEKDNTLL